MMRTPPLLLGAALLFWGWQTGFLLVSALLAVVLEAARIVKARWEFSDDDFSRIWTICTLLFLGAVVFAFTDNGGPSHFSTFFQNPNFATQSGAGIATSRTASAILRWLPMVLFLFVAAQVYSAREEIPLTTISLILRRRWKKARQSGKPMPVAPGMNVSYPYFATCLFAASVHGADNSNSYFWSLCILLPWALWSQRTRRFGLVIWTSALLLALSMGYFGQHGIGLIQAYVQNLDTQWLERFIHRRGTDPTQSRTALGQIGRLKMSGSIIIRLQPKENNPPPTYLREASYRLFTSPVWRAGNSKDDFNTVMETPLNSRIFPLLPDKQNIEGVTISCYLEDRSRETPGVRAGLLPLPSGCGRLENLPAFVLRKNGVGAVLAEGPGLVMFDAFYGPGQTVDSPFNPAESMFSTNSESGDRGRRRVPIDELLPANTNPDLNVPLKEQPALDTTIEAMHLPKGNLGQTLRAVNGYFQSNFTYSTWQELPRHTGTNDTPLSRFLLRTHKGHCEFFASATVLLLREMGIPARYAVGFAVHEVSGTGYVVRERDGHAWCLVWNEQSKSWIDFDTTPASWVEEEASQLSPWQRLSDFGSWIQFQLSRFRWGQSNVRQYLLMGLVPVLGLLFYQIFFRRKRGRRRHQNEAGRSFSLPGLDSEFYLVERKLAERGIVRQTNETLADWLHRALASPALAQSRNRLEDLLRLHYRYRFDPQGLTPIDREELKKEAKVCLEDLSRN
jgi:hypothetical protein